MISSSPFSLSSLAREITRLRIDHQWRVLPVIVADMLFDCGTSECLICTAGPCASEQLRWLCSSGTISIVPLLTPPMLTFGEKCWRPGTSRKTHKHQCGGTLIHHIGIRRPSFASTARKHTRLVIHIGKFHEFTRYVTGIEKEKSDCNHRHWFGATNTPAISKLKWRQK